MVSKFLLTTFVIIFFSLSCCSLVLCQDMAALQAALGGSNPPSCLQSIIPCQSFLHSKEKPPTECCGPLQEVVKNDMECLCKLFNNDKILASVNLTRDDALKLPTHCDENTDLSVCDKYKDSDSPGSSPESSSESKASPPAGGTDSEASEASTTTPSSDKSGANKMSYFGGFSFVAIVAIMISAV